MHDRPYVIVSCTQSLDGYIDDALADRLLLSNDQHFDYVDEVRASVDAILVGAKTIRKDNPRLLVRSEERRAARQAANRPENPLKVTIVGQGEIDPSAAFFESGPAAKVVYTARTLPASTRKQLQQTAEVVTLGPELTVDAVLSDLSARGIRRLMVEGGSGILTQFLSKGLVDELQLATASFFVGDSRAPRFVQDGPYLWNKDNRMKLAALKALGDVVSATYLSPELEAADRKWMDEAFKLSHTCPPTETAYSVGAVIVGRDGNVIATGYSRETDEKVHAEEAALAKVSGATLEGATLYSTLEPCSRRVSRPKSCAQWIMESTGIVRVVYGLREPLFFQDCHGDELLRGAGLTVRVMDAPEYGYDAAFRQLNQNIFQKIKEKK